MRKSLYEIIIIFIAIIIIDSVYLYTIKGYFSDQINIVQGSRQIHLRMHGAVLCYIFICLGLYYFIIRTKKSVQEAFLLGIFVYGIYELTNYSLFDKWKINTVFMDTAWGGILFALVTSIIYKINYINVQ